MKEEQVYAPTWNGAWGMGLGSHRVFGPQCNFHAGPHWYLNGLPIHREAP